MSANNIPAGYQLQIISWENDADCYKTQIFSGLTEMDVRFLVEMGSLFSMGRFGGSSGCDLSMADVMKAMDEVIAKHPDISDDLKEKWVIPSEYDDGLEADWYDPREGAYHDNIVELVSYPEEDYGDQYFRVFDSFQVYYFPKEVVDVTREFE